MYIITLLSSAYNIGDMPLRYLHRRLNSEIGFMVKEPGGKGFCVTTYLKPPGSMLGTGRPQRYSQEPGHREIVTQCRSLALGHKLW